MEIIIMDVTTISVKKDIKEKLEKIKGNLTWNEFFEKIIEFFEDKRKILLAKKLEEVGVTELEEFEVIL